VSVLCRLLIFAQFASAVCATAQTARIKGLVQTEDGTAVAGTRVLVTRLVAPPFKTVVQTAQDGSFDAPGLPAGSYRICPDLPSQQYISPCVWLDPSAIVTVQDGQEVDEAQIVLKLGTTLTVTVDDPGALAQPRTTAGSSPQFLFLAVKGAKNPLYPLFPVARNGSTATYQMTVPFDTDLKLLVQGVGIAVTDGQKNAVPDSGKAFHFTQAKPSLGLNSAQSPNQNSPSFQFAISGKGH